MTVLTGEEGPRGPAVLATTVPVAVVIVVLLEVDGRRAGA